MYDTVKFRLNCLEEEKRYLLSNFQFQLDTSVHYERWSYKLNNLIIKIYTSSITIEGSLAKFYYGENLHLLGREEIKQAIDLLSGILQLDINSAYVTRIDIAATFEMSHNAKCYYSFLGGCARRKKNLDYGTSRYYNSKGEKNSQSSVFYDKGYQLWKKESPLLRFECKWNDRLRKQLNYDMPITAATLSDPEFYRNIVLKWKNKYFDIEKINIPVHDPNICNTASRALKFLTSYLLKSISEKERMDIIEFLTSGLNTQERCRFNKDLKELIGDSSMTKEEPLIAELNYKIRMHVLLELGIL
jgi:hypothetical protein